MKMRLPANTALALFAASAIAIGSLGLAQSDFVAIWAPVPESLPARDALVYVCAIMCVTCGAGLLWRRIASIAARLWLGFVLAWFILFKLRVVWMAPASVVSWESIGEMAVVIAAAWVLYARFATDWDRRHLAAAAGVPGLRIARTLLGLSLIAFGLAHFAYVRETAALVPAWLPAHEAWVYLTGGTYVVAGAALIANVMARAAAALSAVQMGVFTLLVWLPFVLAGPDAFQTSEAIVSLALTASAWLVAESYLEPGARAPADAARPISNSATSVNPAAADR